MRKTASFAVYTFAWAVILAFPTYAKTVRWVCNFETESTPDGIKSANGFVLEYVLDDVTRKAVVVGNNGISDVEVFTGSQGFTFLEGVSTGAIQSTTVTRNGTAVHSRSTIMAGQLVPSQYYGKCTGQ
jgi:hypothetical protein